MATVFKRCVNDEQPKRCLTCQYYNNHQMIRGQIQNANLNWRHFMNLETVITDDLRRPARGHNILSKLTFEFEINSKHRLRKKIMVFIRK